MHEIKRILVFFFGERSKFISSSGNLFHRCATRENITDGVHSMKQISIFQGKKPKYPLFTALLFADDVAGVSDTVIGLQQQLNILFVRRNEALFR